LRLNSGPAAAGGEEEDKDKDYTGWDGVKGFHGFA
jgi:hypothetical protein